MVKPNADAALVLSTKVSVWMPRTVIIAPSKKIQTQQHMQQALRNSEPKLEDLLRCPALATQLVKCTSCSND